MKNPIALLVLALLLTGALALYLVNRKSAPAPLPEETLAPPEAAPGAQVPPVRAGSATPLPEGAAKEEEADLQEGPAPPTASAEGSAPLPPGYPRSQIPHRVARAWGRHGDGSPKRVIGMSIVVDPATSDSELTTLAEDVLVANCDAPRMSVRIYDSEEAMDPEKHAAHDPMIAEHTIGQIWVNPKESRFVPKVRVKIRGKDVLLGKEAIPTGDACNAAS